MANSSDNKKLKLGIKVVIAHIIAAFNPQTIALLLFTLVFGIFAIFGLALGREPVTKWSADDHFLNAVSTWSFYIVVFLLIPLLLFFISPIWALIKFIFFPKIINNAIERRPDDKASKLLLKIKTGEISRKRALLSVFALDVMGIILVSLVVMLYSYSYMKCLLASIIIYFSSGGGLLVCYLFLFRGWDKSKTTLLKIAEAQSYVI